jgi:glycerophosphoryl diester phosphodiesterase
MIPLRTLVLLPGLAMAASAAESRPPVLIAHRGASGYLPEHTAEAVVLAHAQGADYIEQDLVLSRDGVPVVLHDVHLDAVTDAAERFPDRRRPDGRFYALDFTVEELRQLRVSERFDPRTGAAVYPNRFPVRRGRFSIATFEEELELIAGLNHSTGRTVGIYPEIKRPGWHREQGVDPSPIILELLRRHGYRTRTDPCFLQCFERSEVERLRHELGWEGRLILLLGGAFTGDWTALAQTVDGIGPPLGALFQGTSPETRQLTPFARAARDSGLRVHPYTVRADDLPPFAASVPDLMQALFDDAGVDAVFTDFPDLRGP